jgi:hypothetical protein
MYNDYYDDEDPLDYGFPDYGPFMPALQSGLDSPSLGSDLADLELDGFIRGPDGVYYPIEDLIDGEPILLQDTQVEEEEDELHDHAAAEGHAICSEILALPGRLAQRQAGAARRLAESLQGTFMDDDPSSSTRPSGSAAPSGERDSTILPPENQQRVEAEFSAVEHMLCFAAMWLRSVDTSTVPLEDQGRLATYAGQVWTAALRFPHVRQAVEDSRAPLPLEAAQSGTATPTFGAAPLNEEPSSSDRPRRPRRRPRRN